MNTIEFGLMTFADMAPESDLSKGLNAQKRLADLMEEITLADRLGVDVFGVGEHHRDDYAVSSPATVLAAAAVLTKNIKLTSAVSVLSSEDPVRLYQQFATVDLLSGGRAEIMAGRGSFTESFPLFGYPLEKYHTLFEEKLDLLLKINSEPFATWKGTTRASLQGQGVFPRAVKGALPVWIAAGGSPDSAVRAARHRLPLMLAIIGGRADNFVPFIAHYRKHALAEGLPQNQIQVGINNHVFIGESDQQISDAFFPYYAQMMDRVGKDRGWMPMTRQQYDYMRAPGGALIVGSVDTVVKRIVEEYRLFGFTRYLAQASLGFVPHELTMRSIELYATEVVPRVREAIAKLG